MIRNEETNFFGTIDDGLAKAERIFADAKAAGRTRVDGAAAADVYQTYGVPPELVESLAAEHQLAFDWEGFKAAMEAHGVASGRVTHAVMAAKGPVDTIKQALGHTRFTGYESTEGPATVKFIIDDTQFTDSAEAEPSQRQLIVVLDATPFYGESGGQVGDTGRLTSSAAQFVVTNTQRDGDIVLHYGFVSHGTLRTGQNVTAEVDATRRQGIARAHSATHVLHYALQKRLGTHAHQQGSKVDADWLRFDFTNLSAVPEEKLSEIEIDVWARIDERNAIRSEIVALAEARQAGAMMLFGEKYPEQVRMITMGDFSRELCGGTHLQNTADIQDFELIAEEAVAAGTRRVVGLTGERARAHTQQVRAELNRVVDLLRVGPPQVPAAVKAVMDQVRNLRKHAAVVADTAVKLPAATSSAANASYQDVRHWLRLAARQLNVGIFEVADRVQGLLREIETLRERQQRLNEAGHLSADNLVNDAIVIQNVWVVIREIPDGTADLMRHLIDQVRQKTEQSAVLLASTDEQGKVTLVAGVSREVIQRGAHAGKWVQAVAPVVGGGGGGRPEMAQAGGKQADQLPAALQKANEVIRGQLGA